MRRPPGRRPDAEPAEGGRPADPPSSEAGRWRTWRAWLVAHGSQFRLALRITVAALATFVIADLLGLAQSSWAVLTAVIVTQASVGGALNATVNRFVGSLGGAVWGVVVALSVPHGDAVHLGAALVIAVAPLAVVAAINPIYRIAPVTAIILLIAPANLPGGVVSSAVHRMLEIIVGSLVAVAVSLLVLPERAGRHLAKAAGEALAVMAQLAVTLGDGLAGGQDATLVQALHDRLRPAIARAEIAANETRRERRTFLAAGPDPEPLCRALRRLRNSLAMIGQAQAQALPAEIRQRLDPPAAQAIAAAADLLRAAGAAISAQSAPPSLAEVDRAFDAYADEVAAVRRVGLARGLPEDGVRGLFGLAFALRQLRQQLHELTERSAEMVET
ncbi:MAG TPA: FUSC family protein [Caulobacteraceae bacterium]